MNRIPQEKKAFYHNLLVLGFPIIIQNLISAAVNSADVFMLGYVSQSALSAVSLAGQLQFLLTGLYYGLTSGTLLLCAQYWGKNDRDAIQVVMGIGMRISFCATALVAAAALFCPGAVMRIFTSDAELIAIGCDYLHVIGFSYLMMSISQIYESVLRSVERAFFSTVISSTALVLNIFLNAVFIFGLLGAPKLGVLGVAIATVIARSIELVLCLLDAVFSHFFRFRFHLLMGHNSQLFGDFVRYSLPALVNDLSWTVAFSTYSIVLGHMGSDVVAANAVANTVRNLATTICFGMASAGTVLLGKDIGANRMEQAKSNGASLCHITLVVSAITGGIILLLRPLIFSVFQLSDGARDYLGFMLLVSSYYVVGQAINTLIIAGIFRAGGDTKFGLICDTVNMWCIAVPAVFISAFVLHLPVKVVYFILCLDEFYKIPVVYKNYVNYHWLKNITKDNVASA